MNNKSGVQWYQEVNEPEDNPNGGQPFNLEFINMIQKEPNLFRLIVSSLCPQILGQQMVKSGLVLALFGGVPKLDAETKRLSVRSQIHVLMIGDPGSGKHQLLESVHSMAPKANYICGNTSQLSSLTYTIKKVNHEDYYEKGCLASKQFAICCFDEFDKMDFRQLQAVEEAMDQQTVTICHEKRIGELAANVSIVGAINSLKGFYDISLNVWENTRLNKHILSKFDLIFVLVDSPDEQMDCIQSKDILDSRKVEQMTDQPMSGPSSCEQSSSKKKFLYSQTVKNEGIDCQLIDKLLFTQEEEEQLDLIPHILLKQYISYAQLNIKPVLNSHVIELLHKFYDEFETSLISKSQTRNLETLYRLTEARARVELRSVATEEDVKDVIDIMRYSVGKHYSKANQLFPIQMGFQSFKNCRKSQNTNNLLKALQIISEQLGQKVFSFEEIVNISEHFEIPFDTRDEISVAVEKLNESTQLLKNNSNYKLI